MNFSFTISSDVSITNWRRNYSNNHLSTFYFPKYFKSPSSNTKIAIFYTEFPYSC